MEGRGGGGARGHRRQPAPAPPAYRGTDGPSPQGKQQRQAHNLRRPAPLQQPPPLTGCAASRAPQHSARALQQLPPDAGAQLQLQQHHQQQRRRQQQQQQRQQQPQAARCAAGVPCSRLQRGAAQVPAAAAAAPAPTAAAPGQPAGWAGCSTAAAAAAAAVAAATAPGSQHPARARPHSICPPQPHPSPARYGAAPPCA